MLTVIKVTDWIAIVLFLAAAGACVYLALHGHPMCWLVAAGLLVFPVLLAAHRIRTDLK